MSAVDWPIAGMGRDNTYITQTATGLNILEDRQPSWMLWEWSLTMNIYDAKYRMAAWIQPDYNTHNICSAVSRHCLCMHLHANESGVLRIKVGSGLICGSYILHCRDPRNTVLCSTWLKATNTLVEAKYILEFIMVDCAKIATGYSHEDHIILGYIPTGTDSLYIPFTGNVC